MMDMNDIRVGTLVKIDGQPYICLWSDFMRTAQRKPVRRTKLKNLITGNILEQTFKHGDKIEEADVERSKASYLYSDDSGAHFTDNSSFEEITLPKDMVEEQLHYMKDGTEYQLVNFEGKPITVDLPKKVEFKVTSTGDAVRGICEHELRCLLVLGGRARRATDERNEHPDPDLVRDHGCSPR